MELMNKQIGPESTVKLLIQSGKISLITEYDGKGLDGLVQMSVDSDYFMDKIAEKIPGTVDDSIIAVLKMALKSL